MEKKAKKTNKENEQGQTVNLQGSATMKSKLTAHGREQKKINIIDNVRRIQPLPGGISAGMSGLCACPLCADKYLLKNYRGTRTSRAIAAMRHAADNFWAWMINIGI